MSHSTPRAALMTLAADQNAPEATVPAPLAKKIKRSGMGYRDFWRSGKLAIHCDKGAGPRIEYEVFRVQLLLAGEFNGRQYPVRESLPPRSDWGESGLTFTNNSHRDSLAAALAKAQQIASTRRGKE